MPRYNYTGWQFLKEAKGDTPTPLDYFNPLVSESNTAARQKKHDLNNFKVAPYFTLSLNKSFSFKKEKFAHSNYLFFQFTLV